MGSIRVADLGKAYKYYPTRWARLAEWLLPFSAPRHHLKWVLRDISFQVEPGEAVGIVGVNGAGKSTLLKMITGTTQPTAGRVEIGGRVAALLELGMGFHQDFTGRQNAFMAAQLLGLTVGEIDALMPLVESFADIGDYIDQPVRIYSSGMQLRLAFSVATAIRPDILIVDEALAVGDAAFQRKCFRRIEDFRTQGTTLLFVSHDIETVKRLCDKAIFIDHGAVRAIGKAKIVCDEYERTIFGGAASGTVVDGTAELGGLLDMSLNAASIEKQYGDGRAVISDVAIRNGAGEVVNVIPESVPFWVTYRVKFIRDARGVKFGMMLKTADGVCIYGTNTTKWTLQEAFDADGEVSVRFELQGNLVPGTYYLNVGATHDAEDGPVFLHRIVDCLIFRVTSTHWRVAMGYANLFAKPALGKLAGAGAEPGTLA